MKLMLFRCTILSILLALQSNAQQKELQYVSGANNIQTVNWSFFCTGGRNSGYWTKIAVPSHWEQQGFGSYNYGRDYKTNGKNARFADEQGRYNTTFNLPAHWSKKKIFIVFEGSMTDTEVKINGVVAGPTHKGAFYRFKYDITNKLRFQGSNTLEVLVSKMSSDPTVNNAERLADYWVLGGIYRPVYLEAVPAEYIDYVGIDAQANGNFSIKAFLKDITAPKQVSVAILNKTGRQIASVSAPVMPGDSTVQLQMKVPQIQQWTPETPNLHTAVVRLKNAGGSGYTLKEKFGFRTIEVKKGDGIYLNGVQVKMKGVNRHVWWPETGRCINPQIDLLDVQLIKEMNMNAVRCSHYPPDQSFLNYCDSLGLFVLNELAGWQTPYSTSAGEPLVKELVTRDLNHPSIIFWNNGNEGGTNPALDDDFMHWDVQKRPVLHPHHRPGNAFSGIDCNHYEDYYSTQKMLGDSLIYMPTEFLHAQDDGGGGAAMADFWELHWKSKKSGGGFIWAFADEALVRTDMNNALDANGLNANDGILGAHREKEGSFFALKEIFSPVHIPLNKLPANFAGRLAVENRYHFTNLSQCSFQWALVNFRSPFDVQAGYTVEKQGNVTGIEVPPGVAGHVQLPLPGNYKNFDALLLYAIDPFKKEIYHRTWATKPEQPLLSHLNIHHTGATSIGETDSTYTLEGGDVRILINKKTGLLIRASNKKGDQLSISNGPVFVNGAASLSSARLYQEANKSVAMFTYNGAFEQVKWTMLGSGWVELEYAYTLNSQVPFAGVSFNYPENYILGTKWLGKGPYRQWKNRTAGTGLSVWQNLYNNTQTGYYPLVYPEFKGYYGDVHWMEFNTVEGKFYVAAQDTGLFVRLFHFHALTGVRPHPDLPAGDISFLDCIPPIGTKLAFNISTNTRALGPQSELTTIARRVCRKLYFYFGLPKTTHSKEQYSRPLIDQVF